MRSASRPPPYLGKWPQGTSLGTPLIVRASLLLKDHGTATRHGWVMEWKSQEIPIQSVGSSPRGNHTPQLCGRRGPRSGSCNHSVCGVARAPSQSLSRRASVHASFASGWTGWVVTIGSSDNLRIKAIPIDIIEIGTIDLDRSHRREPRQHLVDRRVRVITSSPSSPSRSLPPSGPAS